MTSTVFVDLVGPPVNAAWLNDVNNFVYNGVTPSGNPSASGINYNEGGTGAVTRTVTSKLQESVSVKDFGAKGDGSTDDAAAINAAILAVSNAGGGQVIVPAGTYIVGAYSYTGIAAGVASVVLRSNVHLVVNGTIKTKSGAYGAGALYGVIRSLDAGLSNASITGTGTIDGNAAAQVASTQCSNVYLSCAFNVTVDGIYSVNANGMGIQLIPGGGATHTACAVQNCFVNNCTNIGIQVSHGLYTNISNNRVTTCTNNGIDIYGDNGTTTPDDGVISINGNTIGGVLVGVFVETSYRVVVTGNAIDGSSVGISTNRVNGQPSAINITANTVSNCATGAFVSGDSGGTLVSNNAFRGFTTVGLQLGYGGGNISYINAFGNMFTPNTTTTDIILVTGVQASFNIVRQNYLTDGSHSASHLITNNASSSFNNTLEPLITDTVVQPVKQVFGGASASGGTATITVPAVTSGKLVIKSTAGGAWYSVWSGSFASSGTGVAVVQDSTTYIATGNNIASVTGSAGSLVITITFAASGAAGTWNAWAEYF